MAHNCRMRNTLEASALHQSIVKHLRLVLQVEDLDRGELAANGKVFVLVLLVDGERPDGAGEGDCVEMHSGASRV